MDHLRADVYEFGEYQVDVARQVLTHNGHAVPLTPRVFTTLLCLVRHYGSVVAKDELMRTVWPDTFVEENNLNQNVSTLRRVLGEVRGENRYILTVPGQGYQFVATVRPGTPMPANGAAPLLLPDTGSAEPASRKPGEAVDAKSSPLKLRPRVLAAVAVAAAVVLAAAVVSRSGAGSAIPSGLRTIAVLPFRPLTPNSRDETLEFGMSETLIGKLSSLRGISVRPLSAVGRYGGQDQDAVAAGRDLGVDAILDGRIQISGDRVRVTTHLVNVSDGRQLWAGEFNEQRTDIFSLQDSIAQQVVDGLALELTTPERRGLTRRDTHNTQAYEAYLRGRFLLLQPKRDWIYKAIGFFEEALRRDPEYARAYAGLATCYTILPVSSDIPPDAAFPQARQAALSALRLDPQLADAHTVLGWIALWHAWDWPDAERNFRQALALDPNLAFAHIGYGHLLSDLGRHQEALREADAALRIDPVSVYGGVLKAHFQYQARSYDVAAAGIHRALELDPHYWIGMITLGKIEVSTGRTEQAIRSFRNATAASGGNSEGIALTGYTYGVAGRRHEAHATLRELEGISQHKYVPPLYHALVHQGLGDSAQALRWLERAYDERDVHMVFLGVDPKWDTLRKDARFIRLLNRLNLQR
jgi:DNA-binding winged helix-turn-helix (wHTH) protein/TolB-like protein/tetratricopeptide (TPR) repeat protein